MSKSKVRTVTEKEQRVAVDFLEEIICMNLQVPEGWFDKMMEKYHLGTDRFTGLPCTTGEACESQLEWERQSMDMRYGHHDGLE